MSKGSDSWMYGMLSDMERAEKLNEKERKSFEKGYSKALSTMKYGYDRRLGGGYSPTLKNLQSQYRKLSNLKPLSDEDKARVLAAKRQLLKTQYKTRTSMDAYNVAKGLRSIRLPRLGNRRLRVSRDPGAPGEFNMGLGNGSFFFRPGGRS